MSKHLKRVLAILLAVVMVLGLFPTVAFAAEEDKASLDIWTQIEALRDGVQKKDGSADYSDYVSISDDVYALVEQSGAAVPGSLQMNGAFVKWRDKDTGIPCCYSPSHEANKGKQAIIVDKDGSIAELESNEAILRSLEKKGGSPSSKNIGLIQPYYRDGSNYYDDAFVNYSPQYLTQAQALATYTGGSLIRYTLEDATLATIADTLESCGFVIFDSHGGTDYDNPSNEDDCVTRANCSYLWLSSAYNTSSQFNQHWSEYLTRDEYYGTGTGEFGEYEDVYLSSDGSYCVSGRLIANRMDKSAPNSFLYMGICLGMATDGMEAPIRAKGVEAVYGYSQSVTFSGEKKYMTSITNSLKSDKTIAQAVASAKSSYGNWDPGMGCSNITQAINNFAAFPIVVSSEDTYPGHGNVDALQTVNSTWKLKSTVVESPCTITLKAGTTTWRTVSTTTNTTATLPAYTGTPTGYTFAGWTASQISGTTQSAPTLYNGSYSTGSNTAVTLYACFSKTSGGSGSGTGAWTLLENASTLSSGMKVVFASEAQGKTAGDISSAIMASVDSTFSSDGKTITSLGSDTVQMTVGGSSGAWTFANSDGDLLGATAVKKLAWGSGTTTWSVSVSDGSATIQNGTEANGRFLYNVGSPRFTTYTSGTSVSMLLPEIYYMNGTAGTTTYTTTLTTCSHTYAETGRVAATCTEAGTIEYTCSKCGDKYYDDIPALGHLLSYTYDDEDMHDVVCTRTGCNYSDIENCTYVGGTCSLCGHTKVVETYTVSYNVLGSVVNTASCIEGQSVNLPATATAVEGYTFAGWVKNAINDETSTAPTVLTGSYKPTADVTLYALYTRTEAGTGSGSTGYYLATETPAVGDEIIIAIKNGNDWYALPNGKNSGSTSIGGVALTVTNGRAVDDEDITFEVIENSGDTGIMSTYCDPAAYLALNSSKLALNGWGTTKPIAFEAGTESGTYYIVGTKSGNNGNEGRALDYSGSSFVVDPEDGGSPVYIFTYTEGGAGGDTTYYTTNPTGETPHVHAYDPTGVCSCGDKLISIDSASLRLDEDIDVIYNVTVPEGATASMTFTMNGETTTVTGDGSEGFIFEGVNPQCMGDNISATLNVTYGGNTYSCTKANYSVKTYCTDMLSKSGTSASLKKLLSDTLAYGAAAQTYMSYKTNALVTSGVTGTSYSTFTSLSGLNATFTGTAAESPCWIGASLDLSNNVAMVFRFASPNKTGLSVKVTYNGKTTTFSGTSITAVSGMSGVYEVKLTGIKATDFDETVSASFYKSSAQVGNMVSYSVNTYICAKQADSDANLAALVKALYNYGTSAKAYRPA